MCITIAILMNILVIQIVNKILKGNMDYFELDDETAEKDINFATYIFISDDFT